MGFFDIWPALLMTFWLTRGSQGCGLGSREVGNCLHTFLERDFPAIEAIVYPDNTLVGGDKDKRRLLLDGQELEDQCNRLGEVVQCLEELQHTCYQYHDFFTFRHLVTSLRKAIDWTCSDLRGRFLTLLGEFHCLETARLSATSYGHACHHQDLPANIWQRIIRLETNTDSCGRLHHQMQCLLARKYMDSCSVQARAVYRNLTQVFMSEWCPVNSAQIDRLSFVSMLLAVLALLLITC